MYEQITEISHRVSAAEDDWTILIKHMQSLDGTSNVFNGMKEKEKEIKEKPLAL